LILLIRQDESGSAVRRQLVNIALARTVLEQLAVSETERRIAERRDPVRVRVVHSVRDSVGLVCLSFGSGGGGLELELLRGRERREGHGFGSIETW
jgi:hypothetical protein